MACLVILLLFALIQWLAVPDEEEGKPVHYFLLVLKIEAMENSTHTPQKPGGSNSTQPSCLAAFSLWSVHELLCTTAKRSCAETSTGHFK